MHISVIVLLVSVVSSAVIDLAASDRADLEAEQLHRKDKSATKISSKPAWTPPERLTLLSFDEALSQKLLLVEFFSPYCHHCTKVAPEWAAAQEEIATKYAALNVNMYQVDCVAQADLCEANDVLFYPQIRLYTPVEDAASGKKSTHKFVGTFPLSIKVRHENIVKYVRNVADEFGSGELTNSISSAPMSDSVMSKVLRGEITQTHFVAYFHSTEEEWALSITEQDLSKNPFDDSCIDCLSARLAWGRILNQVSSLVTVGHVNCKSHPKLCEQAGVVHKKKDGNKTIFIAYLPEKTGLISVPYTGLVFVGDMRRFIKRLADNARYARTLLPHLRTVMLYRLDFTAKPGDFKYPLQNKVSVVLLNDKTSLEPKDTKVMARLLKYVLGSPFEVSLYMSDDKELLKDLAVRAHNMIARIPKDADGNKPVFDQKLYDATTFTNAPAVLIYHDNSLINTVYQHVDPENLDDSLLEAFLEANSYPLVQELTPSMLPNYFSVDKKSNHKKVVVSFIDSGADSLETDVNKLRLAATEYVALKQAKIWDQLTNADAGLSLIDFAKGDHTTNMVLETLRKKHPQLFHHDDALFTFIDVGNFDQLKGLKGWKGFLSGIKRGDTFVLSKDSRYMWDTDSQGKKLTSEPGLIAPALIQINTGTSHGIRRKVVNSPYGNKFLLLDTVHDHGFLGYCGMFMLFTSIYYIVQRVVSKRKRKPGNVGILGNFEAEKTD